MRIWPRGLRASFFCLLFSLDAWGGTSVLIVVQRNGPAEITACEHQLRTELLAEGYQPSTVQVPDEPNASLLVDTAKQLSSPAAISITLHNGVLAGLVWLVDPDEPGGLLRTIVDQPTGEQASVVFSVKATNVLEGALLELGYIQEPRDSSPLAPSAPKQPTAASPSPVPAEKRAQVSTLPVQSAHATQRPLKTAKDKTRQKKHAWQLALGAGAQIPFSPPAFFGLNLGFCRRLGQSWALGVEGQGYLPAEAQGERANATIYQFMGGARLDYRQYLGTRLTVYESFVTGMHFAKANGMPSQDASLEQKHPYAYTLYHQLGIGGIWHFTGDFGLWTRASGFAAWRPSDVVVVDETVAKVAAPAVLLDAGMQVSF